MAPLTPLDRRQAEALRTAHGGRMTPCAEVTGVFSPTECSRIIGLRESLGFDAAPIPVAEGTAGTQRAHQVDPHTRQTERTHVLPTQPNAWIYKRVARAIDRLNQRLWQFELDHMEPMQLLAYPEGGHFDWHTDLGDRGLAAQRKLSMTLLLSDAEAYAGGELELMTGGKTIVPGQGAGRAVVFPSFVNHRVRPVTQGVRHVLILWTVGTRAFR